MIKTFRNDDSGFTVVEVLIATVLTVVLGIGVTSTFASSVSSIGGSRTTAFSTSGNSTINSMFVRDVESANGFLIPNNDSVDAISAVSGNGTNVTYTYTGKNTLNVGQNVSISGVAPGGYNVSNAQIQAVNNLNHTFTLSNSTVGALTATGSLTAQCTSWNSGDSTFANVRPLITLSQQSGSNIVSATGTGSLMTFTYTGQANLSIGETISTSGMVPSAYNVLNATILSVDPIAKTFVISGLGSGALTTSGSVIFNSYIGYEVRNSGENSGQLWRIHCTNPGISTPDPTAQILRSGLPLPASDVDWSAAVLCASSSGTLITISSCPINTFLSSKNLYPGVQLIIPSTVASAINVYPIQTVLASRSIA